MTSPDIQKALKKRLTAVLRTISNRTCCDCPETASTWAAIVTTATRPLAPPGARDVVVFLCRSCAEAHMELGSAISHVKNLALDEWDEYDVESAELSGNKQVNDIFEALLKDQGSTAKTKPAAGSSRASRLHFIQEKYVERSYYSRAAHQKHISEGGFKNGDRVKASASSTLASTGSRRSLKIFISSKEHGDGGGDRGDKSVFSGSGMQSVGTTSTSTSSQEHPGERGKKKNDYRDPRRAEFLNSRSSLNYSMNDIEEVPHSKPTKKGPGPIKIQMATTAPSNCRMALYSQASKSTKPRERRERGRSSSIQRRVGGSSTPLESGTERARSVSLRRSEGRGTGRSRGSSQTRRSSTTSRSPARNSRRSRSPNETPTTTAKTTTTPSSRRRVQSPATLSRTVPSPGRRRPSRSRSDKDVLDSSTRRSNDGVRDRSASRTRRNGEVSTTSLRGQSPDRRRTEDRHQRTRSRSSSRLSTEHREPNKSNDTAILQLASRRRSARERSSSRSRAPPDADGKASSENQSREKVEKAITTPATDRRETLRIKLELSKPRADERVELMNHRSGSYDDEHIRTPQYRSRKPDLLGRNTFHGTEKSDDNKFKGNKALTISTISHVSNLSTNGNPSRVTKLSNSFSGFSEPPKRNVSRPGSRKELKDPVTSKNEILNEGEEGFAVISTGHKTLDSFRINFKNRRDETPVTNSFGGNQSGASANGDGQLGLGGKVDHGNRDQFQLPKSRMVKSKASEIDADRVSRRNSIKASLGMDDDFLAAEMERESFGPKRQMSAGPPPGGVFARKLSGSHSSLNKSNSSFYSRSSASASSTDGSFDGRDHNTKPSSRLQRHRIPIRRKSDTDTTHRNRATPEVDFNKSQDGLQRNEEVVGARLPRRRLSQAKNDKNDNGLSRRPSCSSVKSIPEDFSDDDADEKAEKGRNHQRRLADFDKSFGTLDGSVERTYG